MKNIVLIGFQGVGKTFYGKRLASELSKDFIDTDEEIVKLYGGGLSIRDIHIELGEQKFRDLERSVIKRLEEVRNTVLSTGGGIVEVDGIEPLLKRIGEVLYLYNDLEVLQKRWERPGSFLKGKNIERFFKRRALMYERICDRKMEGTWDQILLADSLR